MGLCHNFNEAFRNKSFFQTEHAQKAHEDIHTVTNEDQKLFVLQFATKQHQALKKSANAEADDIPDYPDDTEAEAISVDDSDAEMIEGKPQTQTDEVGEQTDNMEVIEDEPQNIDAAAIRSNDQESMRAFDRMELLAPPKRPD